MRKWWLSTFLLIAAFAVGQNLRYDGVAAGPKGPVPFALVAVCYQPTGGANTAVQPCTPVANLCSSVSDTTCTSPNPLTTDSAGNYRFYVKPSQIPFTVQIYGPQVISQYVLTDQGSNTSSFAIINGPYNAAACGGSSLPSWCSGSDIGAWVNAAAAQCSSGSQCVIEIPPSSQLTLATPIVFVAGETVECPSTGIIGTDKGGDAATQLKYTGSATAVTMNSTMGRFVGCGLVLGSSAAGGIQVGNYSNHVVDASIRDGGSSTVLLHIGSSSVGTEDNHIERVRLSDWTGTAISIDHANDTFLTNITSYGKASAGKGTGLLIDDNSGGVIIDNLVCGQCGHNGFKEQHTLSGNYASFIFARDTEFDNAGSDGMLFDSSLASANIDVTFLNTFVAAAGGAGVHISGGSGIHIGGGSMIRVNQGDGILIDVTSGSAEFATIITGNNIQGNNQSNTSNDSGIRITGHPGTVVITGNTTTNYPEVGGNQAYGLYAQSDVEGLTFTGNVCSQNVTGCMNVSAVTSSKLNVVGNVDTTTGPASSIMPGTLTVHGAVTGINHVSSQGSACASGSFSLGTGWGTSASVGSVSGFSQTCAFTITSGSGSFSSAPTFTFTFPNAFPATPVCTADVQAVTGSGGAIIFNNTTASATAPVFTATTSTGSAFTPAASETYKLVVRCGP